MVIGQKLWRRLAKAAVALVLLVGFVWMPLRSLLQPASTEAVVNARILTVRAPIDGDVSLNDLVPAMAVPADRLLLQLRELRLDRTRLSDLGRLAQNLESERRALSGQLAALRVSHADLLAQSSRFRKGRIQQLGARAQEIRNEIVGAAATHQEAGSMLARVQALAGAGTLSAAALSRARRDEAVAAQNLSALRNRLAAVQVEIEGAKTGSFVGDSYNDRPSSHQRAEEVALRVREIEAQLAEREERLAALAVSIEEENARIALNQAADVKSPLPGRLWEVLVSTGEHVRRGQDLLRLLDCSSAMVTTQVSEASFKALRRGLAVTFRMLGDDRNYEGYVVQLAGIARNGENLAVRPATGWKEPYSVTAFIPALADTGTLDCPVGRTGRIVFGTVDSGLIGASAAATLMRPQP